MQTTDSILMVRPAAFRFNTQTAESNAFQSEVNIPEERLMSLVLEEFDDMVSALREYGIRVEVVEDTPDPVKPDAIFPNNWLSLHHNGEAILYPMLTPNRRHERREEILDQLEANYIINKRTDLSPYEEEERFLEGTGSVIFDHENRRAYACLSPRTDQRLFEKLCAHLNYHALSFHALDQNGVDIYHTNVMMAIGSEVAMVCLDCIQPAEKRQAVINGLEQSGHTMVAITEEQMKAFGGNMMELKAASKNLLVMSQSAFDALTNDQIRVLEDHCELLPLKVSHIESIGGGSVRCMICEIFLPKRPN